MEKEKSLLEKLAAVKKEIGKVSKSSTNPFFKSQYMDINGLLAALEPLLEKNGLILLQPIESGCVVSRIMCINSVSVDGQGNDEVESSLKLPELTDPQKIGSAITYYRRYTLKSLLGIQEEDDDGNKASKPATIEKPKLSTENYEKALNGTKPQIENVIKKYDLSDEQLFQLTLNADAL